MSNSRIHQSNAVFANIMKKYFGVIEAWENLQGETDIAKKVRLEYKYHSRVDKFLAYMLDALPVPNNSNLLEFNMCVSYLKDNIFGSNWKTVRLQLFDLTGEVHIPLQLVTVVLLRDLLNIRKISVRPAKLSSWRRFADSYRDIILSA